MSLTHFRELQVWQLAMQLVKTVYQLTAEFPTSERFGLSSQLQRSAVSIPSNIAEGNGRGGTREYQRFVSIALGSVAELQTQLLVAKKLNLGRSEALDQALDRRMSGESRVPSPEFR